MTGEQVRVGLVGYGYAGRVFHAPLIEGAGLELAVICSGRPEAVLADRPGQAIVSRPEEVLADPNIDLVVIATPNDSHEPLATAALKAGKAVVVDKPFTLDLASARRLTDLAAREGRLLSVFQNRRGDSDFLTVKAAIDEGLVGRVAHFECHMDRFRPQVRDRWREHAAPGGGLWYDLGPHMVDLALQLFGPPSLVTASLAALRDGAQTDDWAHVVLSYDRLRVVLNATMLAAGGSPRFVVHGDKGSLVKPLPDQQEAQLLAGLRPGAPDWGLDPDPLQIWDGEGRMTTRPALRGDQSRIYADIARALRGEGPNPTPAHEALAVMAVLEAGIKSATTGVSLAPDY